MYVSIKEEIENVILETLTNERSENLKNSSLHISMKFSYPCHQWGLLWMNCLFTSIVPYSLLLFSDTEPPVFDSCPSHPIAKNTDYRQPFATNDLPQLTAHDNSDVTPTVNCNVSQSSFPIGITYINCRAVDNSNNYKECRYQVNVAG